MSKRWYWWLLALAGACLTLILLLLDPQSSCAPTAPSRLGRDERTPEYQGETSGGAVTLRGHRAPERAESEEESGQAEATREVGDDDAIAEARRRVRETGGSDASLLALARLLYDADQIPAQPPLTPIAVRPGVDLVRAELLEGRGEYDSAAQIYEDLIRASNNRSLLAWRGLARVRSAQERDLEFIQRSTAVIEQPGDLRHQDLAQIILLRAQSHERMKEYERALADYRTVLESQPNSPVALNNAAWIINAHIAWRAEEPESQREYALSLIDRAVKLVPALVPIRHTKAKILEALERRADALAELDEAIAILDETLAREPQSRSEAELLKQTRVTRARYLLYRAALQRDMDR